MHPDHQLPPWSDLPVELLALIADHLTFRDHIAFSAVCKKFRDAASETIHSQSLRLPWLSFLPFGSRFLEYWSLYSPIERRVLPLPRPYPFCTSFISFKGWFLVAHPRNPHLFNPFTHQCIPLPLFPRKHCLSRDPYPFTVFNSLLVMSSSSPSSPSSPPLEKVAVAFHVGFLDLMVCRLGDSEWTFLINHHNDDTGPAKNVLFFDGLLFCVHGENKVSVYEYDPQLRLKYEVPEPDDASLTDHRCYFVESVGELLMVVKYEILCQVDGADADNGHGNHPTVGFSLYKFDSRVPKWEKMSSLGGDVMLFLDIKKLRSVNVANLSGFGIYRRNCICFEDCNRWFLFCFEDKKITPFSFDVPSYGISCGWFTFDA